MEPKRAAGFLIYRLFNNEIQYLLMKTSYGRNHWTPPKGHLNSNETEYEAAVRETKEETGYTEDDLIIHKNISRTLNYEVDEKPKIVIYWLAQLKDASNYPTLSDEHIDFQFLSKKETIAVAGFDDFGVLVEEMDVEVKKIHGIKPQNILKVHAINIHK